MLHNRFHGMTIVRGTLDDVPAVLHLLDSRVKWLVSRGNVQQWGAAPLSESPKRIEQVKEIMTTDLGTWLAIKVADDKSTTDGEAPGVIVGAIGLGDCKKYPYVTPVSEPEIYVRLLVTDPEWAGIGIGEYLLEHTRNLANKEGVSLIRLDCYGGGEGKLIQYYESQGFERFESSVVEGWPSQVLALRLSGVKGE